MFSYVVLCELEEYFCNKYFAKYRLELKPIIKPLLLLILINGVTKSEAKVKHFFMVSNQHEPMFTVEHFNVSDLPGGIYQLFLSANKQVLGVMKMIKER